MYNFSDTDICAVAMQTLEKNSAADTATVKQLETIKTYAIRLWGDNWLARLCDEYEQKNGYPHRKKNSKVRAWFDGKYRPSLTSFNELLIAVDCEISITSKPQKIL